MGQIACVVLPVHNCQFILKQQVANLIDVMSDIADEFEIRIIDDASTDATPEIAAELATEYPQVTVHRLSRQQGISRAAEVGIRSSSADIVFVCNINEPISHASIMSLWQMRNDDDLVMARSRPSESIRLQDRLDASHGIRMFRRSEFTPRPHVHAANQTAIERITRDDVVHGKFPTTESDYVHLVNELID